MAALKRIILTPYFGKFPDWMGKFQPPDGYDWILDTNLPKFKQRVWDKLGAVYPGEYGSPKVWDYRCALGLLYEEELRGYDYWATMDFDVVFGDVNKFFPDEELRQLDIWSNHATYVAGFWSLYRNTTEVNELFLSIGFWQEVLEDKKVSGWVEDYYSRKLEESGLRYKYSGDLQGDPYHPPFNLKKENGRLFQDGVEVPMLHFRRLKQFPL